MENQPRKSDVVEFSEPVSYTSSEPRAPSLTPTPKSKSTPQLSASPKPRSYSPPLLVNNLLALSSTPFTPCPSALENLPTPLLEPSTRLPTNLQTG